MSMRKKKNTFKIGRIFILFVFALALSMPAFAFGCAPKAVSDSFINNASLQKYRSALYTLSCTEKSVKTNKFVYSISSQCSDMWGGVCHFANITINNEGKAEIQLKNGAINTYSISPKTTDFKPQLKKGVLSITIKQYDKVWIELNGDKTNPLFLFANPPAAPVPVGAVYFGPGVSNIGQNYQAKANTTYYLDDGAYLIGTINAIGMDNVTIMGYGVLSGEFITNGEVMTLTGHSANWNAFMEYFMIRGSMAQKNLMLSGITIVNAPCYSDYLINGFDDVKIITPWAATAHGFHALPQGNTPAVVKNCFAFAGDDVFYASMNQYGNVEISNCFVSSTNNSIFMMGYWGNDLSKDYSTTAKDIYVKPFVKNAVFQMVIDGSASATGFKNMDFENIYVEGNLQCPLIWLQNRQYPWPEQPHYSLLGNAYNLTFKNITLSGRQPIASKILGLDAQNGFSNIDIENLSINGTAVTPSNMSDYISTNSFVTNLTVI